MLLIAWVHYMCGLLQVVAQQRCCMFVLFGYSVLHCRRLVAPLKCMHIMFAGKGAAVLFMCAFMFHSTFSHCLSACMHVDGRQLSAWSCTDSSMLPWQVGGCWETVAC
jgi:hypothetical protein